MFEEFAEQRKKSFLAIKEVKDQGIPYIAVETDYSQADIGQLNTRITAFLEML